MTAWGRKTLRDLSLEGTRTVLVVFAIAVGIAGFLAVLSAYSVLTRELNRGYLATDPPSVVFRVDRLEGSLLADIASQRSVIAAEGRRIVTGRIRSERGEWRQLRLFVAKNPRDLRVGKLTLEHGSWPSGPQQLGIERDAFGVVGVKVGDGVLLRTAAGREVRSIVSGSIHDVGQAQARMENIVYGYATPDMLTGLGEDPYMDRLHLLVKGDRDEVVARVRKLMESRGSVIRRVELPVPGEHPHAHIMDLLLLIMCSFGFGILLMSGVLVVNLVAAMMATQVSAIGVMKAIGATRWQVASIYFAQALLLGATALLIALPVGIAGGRQLCTAMAALLNFDITSYGAPPWVYLLAAITGLLVPVLAAAFPVWNVTRVPVRVALTGAGVAAEIFGGRAFDRALAGMGGTFRPLMLSIRNSFRRRTRLVLTLATLVAGGLLLISGLNIRASMIYTLDRFYDTRKFDLSMNLGGMYPIEAIQRAVRNTPGIVRAEEWVIRGDTAALPVPTSMLRLEIIAGRDLLPTDIDAVVVNTAMAARSHLSVGDRMGSRLVVGIARERFSPAVGYVPRGPEPLANSIRLAVDRGALEQVKSVLIRNLEKEHMRVEAGTSTAESRFSFDQHMVMIYLFLALVSAMIGGIGGLGLMTTMSLNVLERRREIGVLRAIGATPLSIWLIVVTEGLMIGVMSWTIAATLAWPLSIALGNFAGSRVFVEGIEFRPDPAGVVGWLVVSVVLGVAASLLPAWHAVRITVREALSR